MSTWTAYSKLRVTDSVTFVVHDWGSSLGFDWANRNRESVAGIAYMEAFVRPLSLTNYPAQSQRIFQGLRSPAGEEMVLERNLFV